MKLLIQWTRANPQDWEKYDSSQYTTLPKKSKPVGGEVIDDDPGWIHAINVQGVTFQSHDHYVVWHDQPTPGDVSVVCWCDYVVDWDGRYHADWVNTSRTHRETLAYFEGFVQFLSRYQVINPGHAMKLFSGDVSLETQYNQLPKNAKDGLKSTAESMSLDTSSITPTSTLREIIKAIGVQTVAAGTWTPFLDSY